MKWNKHLVYIFFPLPYGMSKPYKVAYTTKCISFGHIIDFRDEPALTVFDAYFLNKFKDISLKIWHDVTIGFRIVV